MAINIEDNNNIYGIQEKFSSLFPFLKLEFFRKSSQQNTISTKQLITNTSKTLAECRTVFKAGHITIAPEMTVSELEKSFNEIYGLYTQVFRKSGNIWLVTTITDNWTLEEQNQQGEIITKQLSDRKAKT
jgi:hypothetical protein